MTEIRILNLLKELSIEDCEIDINDFSKLIPEHVDVITKSLSDILYSTVKENNVSSINRRTNTLHFIRKLCQRNAYHFNITKENYCTVMTCALNKNKDIKTEGECEEFTEEPLLKTIATFYNDHNKKSTEKYLKYERIYEYDKKLLNDDEFHINRALFNANNNFENCYFELTGCTLEDNLQKFETQPKKVENKIKEIENVKMIYALLNLERTKENSELVKRVLDDLSEKRRKTAEEIKIVKYISKNYDRLKLPDDYAEFLKKFPFLYEEIVINFCKNLLSSKEENVLFTNFSNYNEDLVKFCRLSRDIKRKVVDVLYELYSLSNYHDNILLFIKVFDENV